MMKKEKTNRSKVLKLRLTSVELQEIRAKTISTTCRNTSDYTRKLLLSKPITKYYRNQSLDDFSAAIKGFINELNAIGNNYNEIVKRLHQLKDTGDIKTWLIFYESTQKIILKKVSEINSKISEIDDQWLQY